MLRNWELHEDYQNNLKLKLFIYSITQKSRLIEFDKTLSKVYLLNLDSLLNTIKPIYPDIGRPAKNQQGIIRSLVIGDAYTLISAVIGAFYLILAGKYTLKVESWNGSKPKYDIRDWSPEKDRMAKGITLTEEKMKILVETINNRM